MTVTFTVQPGASSAVPASFGGDVTLAAAALPGFGATQGDVELLGTPGGPLALAVVGAWSPLAVTVKLPPARPFPEPYRIRVRTVGPPADQGEVEIFIADQVVAGTPDAALEQLAAGFALGPLGDRVLAPGEPLPVVAKPPEGVRLLPVTAAKAAATRRPAATAPRRSGARASTPAARRAPAKRIGGVSPGGARPRAAFDGFDPVTSDPLSLRAGVDPSGAADAAIATALAGLSVRAELVLELTVGGEPFPAVERAALVDPAVPLAAQLVMAPRFIRMDGDAHDRKDDPATRALAFTARLRLTATQGTAQVADAERVLAGALPLHLLPLPLPTILALFRHRNFDDDLGEDVRQISRFGFALVVAAQHVPIADSEPELKELLDTLPLVVDTSGNVLTEGPLGALRFVPSLRHLFFALRDLRTLTQKQPHVAARRTGAIDNLNRIEMIDQGGARNDTEAENQISSLIMVGPPGAKAELFCKRKRDRSKGRLIVEPGNALAVVMPSLGRPERNLELEGVDLAAVPRPSATASPAPSEDTDLGFNDTISSIALA